MRDREVRIVVFQHSREQGQMVILHEHECGFTGRLLKDGFSENLVGAPIALPVFRSKRGALERGVAKGPEAFVRQAIVVAAPGPLIQPDAPKRVGRILWRHGHVVESVHRQAVGVPAAASDPNPIRRAENWVKRRCQPAGRPMTLDCPARKLMDIGLAVSDDDESFGRALLLQQIAQACRAGDSRSFSR